MDDTNWYYIQPTNYVAHYPLFYYAMPTLVMLTSNIRLMPQITYSLSNTYLNDLLIKDIRIFKC